VVGARSTRTPKLFGLGSVSSDSILSQVFANADATDLFLFPIYKYAILKPEGNTKTLLWTLDGKPALLESAVGKGRLFASAFAFDPTWSDLPMTGSFLPLLRELLSAAIPEDHGVICLDCGQKIQANAELFHNVKSRGIATATGNRTATPGVLVIGEVPYEVNVSRRESVVDKINAIDLRTRLAKPPTASIAPTATASVIGQTDADQGYPLWPACAATVAFLFFLEMLLISLLDHRELAGRRMA